MPKEEEEEIAKPRKVPYQRVSVNMAIPDAEIPSRPAQAQEEKRSALDEIDSLLERQAQEQLASVKLGKLEEIRLAQENARLKQQRDNILLEGELEEIKYRKKQNLPLEPKEKGEPVKASESTGIPPETLKMILEMPEEKQKKAIELVQEMSMRTQNKDEYLMKMLVDQLNKTPAAEVQQLDPLETISKTLEVIGKIEERMKPAVPPPYLQAAPAPVSPFARVQEQFENAMVNKFMEYLSGGGKSEDSSQEFTIDEKTNMLLPKKMTTQEAMSLQEQRNKRLKELEEAKMKEKRFQTLDERLLKPVSKRIPELMDRAENAIDKRAASPLPKQATYPCDCGFQIPIQLVNGKNPDRIVCPKCGSIYESAREKPVAGPEKTEASGKQS